MSDRTHGNPGDMDMTLARKIALILSASFLIGLCLACGSSGSTSTEVTVDETADEPAADGLTEVPNSHGLRARVPAGAVPNGIGGAAGFHSDDNSFSMMLFEDAAATIEAARETAQMLGSVRTVRDEATADGFILVYEARTLDDQMQPTETAIYQVNVKRNIGSTAYSCSGSASTEAQA
ncbi:MAG: hypothetical protein AB7P00_26895, partial [Sandaracinaceae bacterium]